MQRRSQGILWPDSPELVHYTSVRVGGQPFLRMASEGPELPSRRSCLIGYLEEAPQMARAVNRTYPQFRTFVSKIPISHIRKTRESVGPPALNRGGVFISLPIKQIPHAYVDGQQL
jgi:hypothetical protein